MSYLAGQTARETRAHLDGAAETLLERAKGDCIAVEPDILELHLQEGRLDAALLCGANDARQSRSLRETSEGGTHGAPAATLGASSAARGRASG